MPEPSNVRLSGPRSDGSARTGVGSSDCGMPTPVSRTIDSRNRPSAELRDSTAISPVEGELEGVREEVEDDLLPHVAIDIDRLGQVGAIDAQARARPVRSPTRKFDARFAGQLRRGPSARSSRRSRPASMREKSSRRIDQLEQPKAVAVGDLELLAMRRRQSAGASLEHVLDRPEHQRQRRAELVADVGEEGRLGAVELRQRLGAPALLLIGLRRWRSPPRSGRRRDRGSRGSCRRTGGTD